jgi:hypothetical protein
MYVVKFAIASTNNLYAFSCLSKTITVLDDPASLSASTDSNLPPNYIFKFEGDLTTIETVVVKASLFNFLQDSGVSLSGMDVYSGSVYVSGYSSQSSSDLTSRLSSSGLIVDAGLKFVYLSLNDVLVNCTGCVVALESAEESEKARVTQVAVGAIVGGVVGGLVAIALVALGVFVWVKLKNGNSK